MGRDFDRTWSEFQHVSSSPSNINFLPNCFTSRFRTELTLKYLYNVQQQHQNFFLLIPRHLYKILLDSSYLTLATPFPLSVKEISETSASPQSAINHYAWACTCIFFVSKFPTHYRQFRTRPPFTVICFPSMGRGQSAFFAECTKTLGASVLSGRIPPPLLWSVGVRPLGGERGRKRLCFAIHRAKLDSLTPLRVATVSPLSEWTVFYCASREDKISMRVCRCACSQNSVRDP